MLLHWGHASAAASHKGCVSGSSEVKCAGQHEMFQWQSELAHVHCSVQRSAMCKQVSDVMYHTV